MYAVMVTLNLIRKQYASINMVAKGDLRWTEENERSVKEYRKKVEAGEIKPVKLENNLRDILKKN